MADTAIAISAGTGTNVDTRTEATNGNHRQVIVIGDPSTNASVAAVMAANIPPVAGDPALVVALSPNGLNANGSTTSANSAPVVIASDQVAVAIKAASGTIASGAIASGAVASGAIASGAIASGAVASGAFASGSIAAGAVAAGATSFVKLEDVASADADAGVPAMMVRKATAANTSGTDGDYEFLQGSVGALWVANPASTDKTLLAERVINGGSQYEPVAVSTSNQAMGATGAAGDYLSHVIVSPITAGCGVVTILDNATAVASFPGGGTTALSNLIPFVIPIGIISTSGAWKITTGANVTAVGVGRFT